MIRVIPHSFVETLAPKYTVRNLQLYIINRNYGIAAY